jgi:hypothetical protein
VTVDRWRLVADATDPDFDSAPTLQVGRDGKRSGGVGGAMDLLAQPLGLVIHPTLATRARVGQKDVIDPARMIAFVLMVGSKPLERVARRTLTTQS